MNALRRPHKADTKPTHARTRAQERHHSSPHHTTVTRQGGERGGGGSRAGSDDFQAPPTSPAYLTHCGGQPNGKVRGWLLGDGTRGGTCCKQVMRWCSHSHSQPAGPPTCRMPAQGRYKPFRASTPRTMSRLSRRHTRDHVPTALSSQGSTPKAARCAQGGVVPGVTVPAGTMGGGGNRPRTCNPAPAASHAGCGAPPDSLAFGVCGGSSHTTTLTLTLNPARPPPPTHPLNHLVSKGTGFHCETPNRKTAARDQRGGHSDGGSTSPPPCPCPLAVLRSHNPPETEKQTQRNVRSPCCRCRRHRPDPERW
jgi:hypothetical protein